MMASYEPRWPPPHRHGSAFCWCSPGILLVALGLLLPVCSDACDAPIKFETMMLNGPPKALYGPGDRVEFKCHLGYKRIVPFVPTTAVCQPDNTWAPPLQEACIEKTCPPLGEPLNGQLVYVSYVSETSKFGSQAHFVCNEGYYLLGPKNLYCELSGNNVEWNGSPPQCEKILCQPPQQIPNGDFSNSHKDTFEYNEVVTYHCKPSNGPDEYSLVGESSLICSGRNQWSSNPPECKVVKCQYPVLNNGKIISGLGKKFYYKSEVTVECLEGFYLEGNRTVVCGVNNNWEPKMPKCIKGTKGACDDLPTFASMKLKGNPAPHYTPGDTVEYECLPGYKPLVPVLPTSAVCQPDNTWKPLQEACTRKSCPPLVDVQNAQIFYTHGTFQFGSQAHYVCNEGYNLIGVNILYCNLSGNNVEWSDNPPQCEKILCQPPRKISNGKCTKSLKDTFKYNEVVIYSPNPSNGPDKYSLIGGSRLLCIKYGVVTPQCKLVKCDYPVLENGRLVSGHEKIYHYKAKVVFECLEGFDLQGSSTVFCGSNNNWEPKMPKCIKGDFPEVEFQSLENVNPEYSATPPETSFLEHSTPSSTPPPKDNKEYGGGLIALMVLQQFLALQ